MFLNLFFVVVYMFCLMLVFYLIYLPGMLCHSPVNLERRLTKLTPRSNNVPEAFLAC